MTAPKPRIGLICPADHEMFGPVADRLRDRGYAVEFLEPGVELSTDRLDALDLLVNKKVRWESLHALEYAHRNGIPAWNGYVASMVFFNRLSQLGALAAVGFQVPDVHPDKPDGDFVAKGFLDIHEEPTLNGDGDFYQPLLDFDGIDHKYYAVDDGKTVQTAVTRFESKLFGERAFLGRGTPDPAVERRLARLLRFSGARALGVDVVEVDGESHAVDVNPATSFRRTGLEAALVESIASAVPR
ncbi:MULTISPECIES: histidine kinase [Salinibaculum]|uniref:histidine kinase n=1 Tax=Salinibaculum TaxID=2732368 RepID=UPI0030D584C2